MLGIASENVQEMSGKTRYNFRMRFLWGIPRYEEDVEKLEKSVSAAVRRMRES